MEQYISSIITDSDLNNIRAGEFNVLRAPRGYGKTEFMFDDRILKLAREKKHVLYLIHNKLTRNAIAAKYPDKAKVFDDCNCNGWFLHRRKGLWTTEEDENFVHVMCYQTFAALLRNEGYDWLDDIDLIVWDEFDDIKCFYEKDVKKLRDLLPNFSRERLIAILQEGNSKSNVNFVYQIKTYILDPAKIKLLAISATPENAAEYFRDYINYIFDGKLQEKYSAKDTIYIKDVIDAMDEGIIHTGRKYWCLVKTIHEGFQIAKNGEKHGFKPLVLWSDANPDWSHLMTAERKEALKLLREQGMVPPQYDMVIITTVGSRGINIYDKTYQDWICNSTEYEDIGQYLRARFCPEREYLLEKTRGMVDFIQNGFSVSYYTWHSVKELKELLKEKPIYSKDMNKRVKLTTIQAVAKEYPELFEKRTYGRAKTTQYRIKPAE